MEYWQEQLYLYAKGHYPRTACEKDAKIFAEKNYGVPTHRLTRAMFVEFVRSVAVITTGQPQSESRILPLLSIITDSNFELEHTNTSLLVRTIIEKRKKADEVTV